MSSPECVALTSWTVWKERGRSSAPANRPNAPVAAPSMIGPVRRSVRRPSGTNGATAPALDGHEQGGDQEAGRDEAAGARLEPARQVSGRVGMGARAQADHQQPRGGGRDGQVVGEGARSAADRRAVLEREIASIDRHAAHLAGLLQRLDALPEPQPFRPTVDLGLRVDTVMREWLVEQLDATG
jgi:hypothetical protein